MHDIFSREPDPLEGLLAPPPLPPDSEALQQQVYTRTRRVLRRRRLIRRCAYAAGLAVSFAAGLLVMWMILPAHSASKGVAPPVALAHKEESTPQQDPPDSALACEWRAFDSEEQRGELYRQAGNTYMEEECDPLSALRCYTNALDHGTEQDRTISAEDNWLLMAIKDARQKESAHAKTGG